VLTLWFSREGGLDNPEFDREVNKVCPRIIHPNITLNSFTTDFFTKKDEIEDYDDKSYTNTAEPWQK